MRWNNREDFQKEFDKKQKILKALVIPTCIAEGLIIGEAAGKVMRILPFGPIFKTVLGLGIAIPAAVKVSDLTEDKIDELLSKQMKLPTEKEYNKMIWDHCYSVGVDLMMDKYST